MVRIFSYENIFDSYVFESAEFSADSANFSADLSSF